MTRNHRLIALAFLLLAVVGLASTVETTRVVLASAKGCVGWFAAGGFGHLIFDALTYGAVFFFGTKVGKHRACRH